MHPALTSRDSTFTELIEALLINAFSTNSASRRPVNGNNYSGLLANPLPNQSGYNQSGYTRRKMLYLHIKARACWRWICVRWVASCWWCAKVCFMRTIRMLCSIAYFLALATRSCWSDVSLGKAPPRMPSSAERDPGPNSTSPSCRRSFIGVVMKGIFGCHSTIKTNRKTQVRIGSSIVNDVDEPNFI